MKAVIAIIVLALIAFGGWFLLQSNAPEEVMEEADEMMADEMAGENMDTSNDTMETNDDEAMDGTDAGMEFPTLDSDTDASADAETKVFDVDAFNFDFSVDEIRVQEGDTVTINLTSTDGFHDFVVDGLDAATARVNTGQSTSVTFVADEAGTYEFYCSVGNHRQMGMVGTLVVE